MLTPHEIRCTEELERSIGKRWIQDFVEWFITERKGTLGSALEGIDSVLDKPGRAHAIGWFMKGKDGNYYANT